MNVTVLGGSAAGPNTGAGCAGFLIQHEETAVVLDLGPNTLLELRKHVDFRNLTALVTSHYHLDHILDLGAMRYSLSYNPRPADRKLELLMPPGTLDRFALWGATFGHDSGIGFWSDYFAIREFAPSAGLAFPGITIDMAATVHPEQGWAMRVTAKNGGTVGYTADTGPRANLAAHFAGVDLLISEATEAAGPADDDPDRGHLLATEAGRLASDASVKLLMLTHMWEEDDQEACAALAATTFDGPILIARPGLQVHL